MSATRREREDFLVRMSKLDVPTDVARKLLRYGATLQRLAEAACNGDWPCDNGGERKVVQCGVCEGYMVRSKMVTFDVRNNDGAKVGKAFKCEECRTQDLATALLVPYGLKPMFQGDPRGAVLSIVKVGVAWTDFESGRERGWAVPA